MKKDPKIFIGHILESIELIESYIKDKTEKEFSGSSQLQDSVIRRLEIIGEAAKNVPQDIKDKFTEIPWKRMAGMRDIIVHEYFGIDLKLTWRIAKDEIPELKEKILKVKVD